jgi:fucose permease
MSSKKPSAPVVPRAMLLPFILVTILFPLWGFANDITNPMVAAFKNILLLTNFESSLVQAAFYGGYALMAIPAAIFIKKFSYKKGILLGLTLYALGCLLFIPSGWSLTFAPFLLAYLIMTCGLSFLETTANPYVLSMGDETTATRRLNLAQAFNPMGSICGMFVASMFILANLNGTSEPTRRAMKAVSEGTSVHVQAVEAAVGLAGNLETTLNSGDFGTRKRVQKKAAELAAQLEKSLTVLADPKLEDAEAIAKELAAQPSEGRFAEAAQAVAIVMQLREKRQPSEAEARRDALYQNHAGMEFAMLLGRERALLESNAQFGNERISDAMLEDAKAVAGVLQAIYSGAANAPVEDVKAKLGSVQAALSRISEAWKAVPAVAFAELSQSSREEFKAIQKSDLGIVVGPYALMGGILLVIVFLFAWKLPHDSAHEGDNTLHFGATLSRLVRNGHYLGGVVAQTFYVGAQIMCWTFIIQYAESELGVSKSTAQNCNILAMIIFVSSRFICTFLLHYIRPGTLLALLAVGGLFFTLGTIFIQGYAGLYCLIGVSACMSLMFPTIYGIALEGLGDDAKLGSAGLILAIGGGCLMPPLQGAIIDLPPVNLGFIELASVRASFFLPAICFVVIAAYGFWVMKHKAPRTAVAV